jgi:hypothetical protein
MSVRRPSSKSTEYGIVHDNFFRQMDCLSEFQCAVSLPPIRLLSRHFVHVLYQVVGGRTAIVFVTRGSQIVFIDTSLKCTALPRKSQRLFLCTQQVILN